MNNIPLPSFDDAAAFMALSLNSRVGSFPYLQSIVATVHASYAQYVSVGGNPRSVQNQALCDDIAGFMRGHYASPPNDLVHITEMRDSSGHLVCPMCGSMHSGTLDHYLPKNGFPIFAIFSKNLVPACKCNILRKEVLTGADPNERVLHPYFDACLSERLIRANFEDLGPVPRVSVVMMIASTHANFQAVRFHFRNVVQQTAIQKYLADRWSSLFRKPSLVVRALAHNVQTQAELEDILMNERDNLDDLHGSKNNWNSVFVSGLLEPSVLAWLTARLSAPGRVPNDTLQ